jgi:hypothetical protein
MKKQKQKNDFDGHSNLKKKIFMKIENIIR